MEVENNELQHYGVLGMKWGVRKDGRPQGYGNPNYKGPIKRARERKEREARKLRGRTGEEIRKTRSGNFQTKSGKAVSRDAANARRQQVKARVSGSDSLSNKELQSLVNRMNLEQQYDRLTTPTPQKSLGKQFIERFMKDQKFRTKVISLGSTAAAYPIAVIQLRKMIERVKL